MLSKINHRWVYIYFYVFVICIPSNLASKCRDRIENSCEIIAEHQCYFDTDRTCFKHFRTNCEMEISACNYGKEYREFPQRFCESLQFMCNEEIDDYEWPPDYFDKQIANIRNKQQNPYEGMY